MQDLTRPDKSRASSRLEQMAPSLIRMVAEAGMRQMAAGGPDVVPLWFGEGPWTTPAPIVEAARAALAGGDHFYQPNLGRPALRQGIADYHKAIYGLELDAERVCVTASGMQAVSMVAQALIDPGDEVVVVGPVWPNLPGAMTLAGGVVRMVAISEIETGWTLPLERLIAAVTSRTKAIVINSPSNPTGWVMPDADQTRLLDFARARGIWLVSDDVYSRLYYSGPYAPFLLAKASNEDLVVSINSFSKTWSMTGWRLGWIVAPAWLTEKLGPLTEFTYSCAPGFVQQAGLRALEVGEPFFAETMARLRSNRALLGERLGGMPGIRYLAPEGAFYAFIAIEGLTDSVEAALRLIREAGVGLAPGRAFGPEGEGYLRLCYAQEPDRLAAALERMGDFFARG